MLCCTAGKFFYFLLFLLLTLDYFTHVGIMSVNVSSNLQIATTVLLTLIPTWNVLSGFYIPKPVSSDACHLLQGSAIISEPMPLYSHTTCAQHQDFPGGRLGADAVDLQRAAPAILQLCPIVGIM